MSDWRETIGNIIAETERNLGTRIHYRSKPPPPAFYMPHPPDENTKPPFQQASGQNAESAAANQSQGWTAELSRASHTRVVDSVKFELDIRSSLMQKQLEAVREEMNASVHDAERRWLEVAKKIEHSVSSQLESERKLRSQAESQLQRLQDSAGQSQQETFRLVSEFQSTALDHGELLRRLDQDLANFKLEVETKLAEHSRLLQPQTHGSSGFDFNVNSHLLAGVQHPLVRLSEVEQALLQEREFRKVLEDHVLVLRDARDEMPSLIAATVQQVRMHRLRWLQLSALVHG